MLTVTRQAVAVLKAAKSAEGAAKYAGIRIRTGAEPNGSSIAVGFAVREEPDPGDMELEQHGLRIFVEDVLVEPLDGRVLDVREAEEKMELVFR